jgi:hypothetical protein
MSLRLVYLNGKVASKGIVKFTVICVYVSHVVIRPCEVFGNKRTASGDFTPTNRSIALNVQTIQL